MNEFPDIVDKPMRVRFANLGLRPGEVEERFVRGTGAGGQKINKIFKSMHTDSLPPSKCQ